MRHLELGDIHAFVNLDVRANIDAKRFGSFRHGLHVALKYRLVDDHARRRQNVFGHVAEIAATNEGFELCVRKPGGTRFRGPNLGGR